MPVSLEAVFDLPLERPHSSDRRDSDHLLSEPNSLYSQWREVRNESTSFITDISRKQHDPFSPLTEQAGIQTLANLRRRCSALLILLLIMDMLVGI